jgi:hypothetical protein
MWDCIDDCPYLTELASLRRYKEHAEKRISELEASLAQRRYRSSLTQSCCSLKLKPINPDLQSPPSNPQYSSRISRLEEDVSEWQQFAHFLLEQLRPIVPFSGDFPQSDSSVQRFILTDLVLRAFPESETRGANSIEYQSLAEKYEESQRKLREVRAKCSRMLAMMRERKLSDTTHRPRREHRVKESDIVSKLSSRVAEFQREIEEPRKEHL